MSNEIQEEVYSLLPDIRSAKKELQKNAKEVATRLAERMPADEVYVAFYKIADYCKTAADAVKPKVLDSLSGDEKREVFGQVLGSYIRGNYSYNHCLRWVELVEERDALNQKIEALEEAMRHRRKNQFNGMAIFDPETGEEIPPARYTPSGPFLRMQ